MALQSGVPVGVFWDLSLVEIESSIEAYNAREEYGLKQHLQLAYELADAIGNRVSMIFSKENTVEYMSLEAVHPELFGPSEEEKAEREKQRQMFEAEKQAQSRREFARKWNPILRAKYGSTQTPSNNRIENNRAEEGHGESQSRG